MTISAAGYIPQTKVVTVPGASLRGYDFTLVREGGWAAAAATAAAAVGRWPHFFVRIATWVTEQACCCKGQGACVCEISSRVRSSSASAAELHVLQRAGCAAPNHPGCPHLPAHAPLTSLHALCSLHPRMRGAHACGVAMALAVMPPSSNAPSPQPTGGAPTTPRFKVINPAALELGSKPGQPPLSSSSSSSAMASNQRVLGVMALQVLVLGGIIMWRRRRGSSGGAGGGSNGGSSAAQGYRSA